MLSTFRFLLDLVLPSTPRSTSGAGETGADVGVSATTAVLSNAAVMSGAGDVACFINGDRSLTTGVLIVAPSASSRPTSELTGSPLCNNTIVHIRLRPRPVPPLVGQSQYTPRCQIRAAPCRVTLSRRLVRVAHSWLLRANMT